MNKQKAIIWRRGSTDRQEIETQDKELTQLAINEGFKEENLIHIGEAGASAIKQNDLYLMEVEKLITTLENDKTVKTVFVWEISRLARVELAFYQMKDYFIKNNVQLICKTPSLRLFDNDGTVNKGSEVTLSLLVVLAKQEMEIKQSRFKRARDKRKEEGKFTGGKIKLGYKLDKDKYFVIDEDKAKVVRNIFEWFVNDGLTLNKINMRLIDMGIYHTTNPLTTCGKRVGYLLRDESYRGIGIYPRIVNDDIWYKANERLKGHQKSYDSKNKYFCKGILRDKLTNTLFAAKVGRMLYVMRHKIHSICLNINAMDYIALYSANVLLAHYNAKEAQTNKNEYQLKLKENERIIKSKQKQIEEYEKMNQRAIQMNIMRPEHFPEERLNVILKQNDNAIQSLTTALNDIHMENARMQNWLDGKQQFVNTITSDLSDDRKREMIQSVIETIYVTKIGQHHYRIDIKNKVGYIDDGWFEYKSAGNSITLAHHLPYGEIMDLTQSMKNHKRFERKN